MSMREQYNFRVCQFNNIDVTVSLLTSRLRELGLCLASAAADVFVMRAVV